jgi:hypothetical protein
VDPALRLQPGKPELTPEQEAASRRFAEAYIREQLSTEPVDEQQAEALLCQAYAAAGLDSPQCIHWLDGPLQLVAVVASGSAGASMWDRVGASVRDRVSLNERTMGYFQQHLSTDQDAILYNRR